jgi:GntR family transcriptional regulator/MocR family aminotransferase
VSRPELILALPEDDQPLYLRVARAIEDAIRGGRLRPGDAMPGSRSLADRLGVHRNTVKNAYAELIAQDWLRTQPSSSTFVSPTLPVMKVRPSSGARDCGFAMPALALPPADNWAHLGGAQLNFWGMDPQLMPVKALARAYRGALRGREVPPLDYHPGRGHPRLIRALGAMLSEARGLPPDVDLLVTRGSQMGLSLTIRALLRPGDVVAVEEPGYAYSWPAFALAGVRLVPIAVDGHGMIVDSLARVLTRTPVRAVLVTPHMQYPTGVTLSAARRLALLTLATRHRFAIIEDDFVNEVRYDGPPVLPLASRDPTGVTIYLGSLSKTFAPSLRIGYVAGPSPFIERLTRIRALVDVCGDSVLELAVAGLIEDGELQRHVRRLTRVYRERRARLAGELRARLGSAVSFEEPAGGTALWIEVDPAIDVEAWAAAALIEGVGILTGRLFFLDGRPRPYLWLGFAGLAEDQLGAGVAGMARALQQLR